MPFAHIVDEWTAIEREARDQVRAELIAEENTPLAFGQHVAWTTGRHGLTDDVSLLHRVGGQEGSSAVAICGDVIPPPICWMPLGSGLVRTLERCRYCEAEYKRTLEANREAAA